ncbi:MAG: PEGA domain-containing protein, partial [Myxococcales bacterium]
LTRPSRPAEGWRGLRLVLVIGAAAAIVVVAGFAFLVQQPAAQRPGKIVVTVSPAVDAELFVDGHSSGRVPPHLRSLAAGDHLIEVKAAGYRAFATTVSVRSGSRPVEIDAALQPEERAPPATGGGRRPEHPVGERAAPASPVAEPRRPEHPVAPAAPPDGAELHGATAPR